MCCWRERDNRPTVRFRSGSAPPVAPRLSELHRAHGRGNRKNGKRLCNSTHWRRAAVLHGAQQSICSAAPSLDLPTSARTHHIESIMQAQFPCKKLKGETEHTKGGIGTLLSSVAETAVYLWTGTCLRLAPCRSGVAAWGLSGGGVEGMPLFFNFVPAPRHFTHNTDSHTSTPKKRGGQHYLSDRVSVRCIGFSCRSTRDANSRPIEPVSAPSHRPRCG